MFLKSIHTELIPNVAGPSQLTLQSLHCIIYYASQQQADMKHQVFPRLP